MAAVGALLMSSGIALMAAPASADATPSAGGNVVTNHKPPKENLKDWVCKYVGTPGVDEHLKQGNDGLVWVSTHASEHSWFNDAHGRSFVLYKNVAHNPRPSASECPTPDNEEGLATASVTFIDPSCENDNTASYETSGEHVVFKVFGEDDGGKDLTASSPVTVSPGSHVKIVAFALKHFKFENGKKWMVFEHTFGDVVTNCTEVTPAAPTYVEPTCTTLPSVQTPTSELVKYTVTGSQVAGGSVHIVATLVNSETSHFADGATTTWDHTFTVPTGCTAVSPPTTAPTTQVSPPKTHVKHKAEVKAQTTTPTVVHAGLASTTTSTQTGLGLTAAGLVLMAGAAGLVLEEGRRKETA